MFQEGIRHRHPSQIQTPEVEKPSSASSARESVDSRIADVHSRVFLVSAAAISGAAITVTSGGVVPAIAFVASNLGILYKCQNADSQYSKKDPKSKTE